VTTDAACIAAVALLWGGYPLVTRTSGFGGTVGTLVLSLAGLVPVTVAAMWTGFAVRPSRDQLLRLGIAGLMMGVGLIAFNRLANGRLDASVSIPIVDVAMLLVSTVGALWFFDEPVTAQKVIGIVLLVTGIALLRPT
jgi:drug/metabolite transporter (DMT)-like permease